MAWFCRRSWLLRSILGITGAATLWCLGCSAFEPLMACGDADPMGMRAESRAGDMKMESRPGATALNEVSPDTEQPADCLCGCVSCYGAVSPEAEPVAEMHLRYTLSTHEANAAPSPVRLPLVPPPQPLI